MKRVDFTVHLTELGHCSLPASALLLLRSSDTETGIYTISSTAFGPSNYSISLLRSLVAADCRIFSASITVWTTTLRQISPLSPALTLYLLLVLFFWRTLIHYANSTIYHWYRYYETVIHAGKNIWDPSINYRHVTADLILCFCLREISNGYIKKTLKHKIMKEMIKIVVTCLRTSTDM